jgi:hypothetical protein
MNFDLTTAASGVPALFSPDPSTARRTLEFFTADIRNANTRRAYARAGADFAGWCSERGLTDLSDVEPVHVATYVEQLKLAPPSIKQRLAALRRLFDWLVVGQVIPTNPATSVRGPRYSSRKGKTPVLSAEEVRELVDSIDAEHPDWSCAIGRFIGTMVYTFARVGRRSRGCVSRMSMSQRQATVGAAAREGRQAPRDAVPPPAWRTGIDDYLEAARHLRRSRRGYAVPVGALAVTDTLTRGRCGRPTCTG